MAIYEKYPKSVSQNPKPYENTFKPFTLDTCTSAVANQVCFRTIVSIGIQQAQSQGVGPKNEIVSSECVIWDKREHMHATSVS